MPEGYLEAPLAYDAIWAVALGKKIVGYLKLFDEGIFTLINDFMVFRIKYFDIQKLENI